MKYHVNLSGVVGICKAKPGKCPFQEIRHFDTREEAEQYAQDEHRALRNFQNLESLTTKAVLGALNLFESSKATEFRCLMERVHQDDMLKNDVTDVKAYTPNNEPLTEAKRQELMEVMSFVMPGHTSLKAVHLMIEDELNWYIWTNATDQRDVIVYDKYADRFPIHELDKKNKYITHIEVKDLTRMAQLSQTRLEKVGTHVQLATDNPAVTENMKKELATWNTLENAYENRVFQMSEEEHIHYLLDDYYHKGANELSFYSDKKKKMVHIHITKNDRENNYKQAKEIMKRNGITVEVSVRCNNALNNKTVTREEKLRFLENYGILFKDGIAKEKFTINDLNRRNRMVSGEPNMAYVRTQKTFHKTYTEPASRKSKTFIRLGDFFLDLQDDPIPEDKVFSIDDFSIYQPIITGNIKEK